MSVVVLMRGCSGTDEYEAGKEKKSQYTYYKKLDYTTGENGHCTSVKSNTFNKVAWHFYNEQITPKSEISSTVSNYWHHKG